MPEETTDWIDLREFKAVLLTESYVLSWAFESGSMLIDIDLCLSAEHPFYETLRPAETKCIRQAIIEFPACSSATVNAVSRNAASIVESLQTTGGGLISGLRRTGEGRYELSGKFGVVDIYAERPILRITSEGL